MFYVLQHRYEGEIADASGPFIAAAFILKGLISIQDEGFLPFTFQTFQSGFNVSVWETPLLRAHHVRATPDLDG